MQSAKDKFRINAVKVRDELPETQRTDKSRIIKNRLLSLSKFTNAEIIMCYVDFRSEVKTREFIREAVNIGKKIAVPIIIREAGSIDRLMVSLVENIDTDLEKGYFGISEPKRELMRLINPGEIDLAVIPGVAFDLQKHRMGYGKGFYDRFLTKVRTDCTKIGICFDIQLFENMPHEIHDIQMNMIITENRVIADQ